MRLPYGVKARREELGRLIATEAGKPIRDALVEVDRATLTFRRNSAQPSPELVSLADSVSPPSGWIENSRPPPLDEAHGLLSGIRWVAPT